MRPPRFTDDPDPITAARRFINTLDEITEVDHAFQRHRHEIWKIGPIVPLSGIGGRIRAGPECLPTPVIRMFLWHSIDYQP
jgi:hypothetical protein